MKKLLVIALNEVRLRYLDLPALFMSILVPLIIATLIQLAFGHMVLGRSLPEAKSLVGVVNQDEGSQWGNFGQLLADALLSDRVGDLFSTDPGTMPFNVRQVIHESQARRLVEDEEMTAVLLIPPNFSEELAKEHAALEVYINSKMDIEGMAFKGIVETLANMISSGEVAVRTTVQVLLNNPRTRAQLTSGQLDEAIADLALNAAKPASILIQISRLPPPAQPPAVKLAHYLAASLAIMSVSLTALMVSANLYHDQEQGTLQRTYITPTQASLLFGGKIFGTYLAAFVQMGVLVVGMAALESLLGIASESPKMDVFGLLLLILSLVMAATGMGVMLAGLVGSYTQAANYGRMLLILMGLLGGLLFPVDLFPQPIEWLSRVTYSYWALQGFIKLALGGYILDILPHSFVLVTIGIISFAVGSRLLRRRIGFL